VCVCVCVYTCVRVCVVYSAWVLNQSYYYRLNLKLSKCYKSGKTVISCSYPFPFSLSYRSVPEWELVSLQKYVLSICFHICALLVMYPKWHFFLETIWEYFVFLRETFLTHNVAKLSLWLFELLIGTIWKINRLLWFKFTDKNLCDDY
jgi:hypothetical protein